MSTSALFAEAPAPSLPAGLPPAVADVVAEIDPRMQARVIAEYQAARAPVDETQRGASLASASSASVPSDGATPAQTPARITGRVVLVGHRAAGKSRVLPAIARLLRRDPIDLDRELERVHGRALRDWVASDLASFRSAERALFPSLPDGCVVAVGGGFWSNHPDVLAGQTVVQIPVSFRTYRERLLADTSRPRLVQDVSLEEEIRRVYRSREFVHRVQPQLSLGAFLAVAEVG